MNAIIIGFGNMGKLHYSKLISRGIKVPIIVESEPENINVDSIVYSDIAEIPSFDNIDFIFICTPTNSHFNILNKSLDKNIPVFLEKPAVRTFNEVEALKEIKNKFIFVGEVELFNEDLRQFVEYQSVPASVSIERKVDLNFFLKGATPWFLDEKLSGGIVLDLMIHDITLLIFKFGVPKIKLVECSKNKFEIYDYAKVILSFNSFDAELTSSWIENDKEYPVKVLVDIVGNEKNTLSILSNNYMKEKKRDAFDNQLDAFLTSILENKLPYNFNLFCDATELCLKINSVIEKGKAPK